MFRSLVFTLNNYTETQITNFKGNIGTIADYAIFGKEVGANGTPHLQGYIKLIKRTRFNPIKQWFTDNIQAQPHIEAAKGSPQQNKAYCSKQNDFWEFGECPRQGKRNDLTQFLEDAKVMDKSELQDTHPSNYIRYHKAAADVKKTYDEEKALDDLKDEYKDAALRQWQTDVLHDLLHQDDREIIWLVDEEGGKGKTWFSKYLIANHHAFYVRGESMPISPMRTRKNQLLFLIFQGQWKNILLTI